MEALFHDLRYGVRPLVHQPGFTGMLLAVSGVAIGLVGSLGLTRLLTGLLFDVSVTDPLTFGLVPVLLLMIALLAIYLPARRATRVDPLGALPYE